MLVYRRVPSLPCSISRDLFKHLSGVRVKCQSCLRKQQFWETRDYHYHVTYHMSRNEDYLASRLIFRITCFSVICFSVVRATRRQRRHTSFVVDEFTSCISSESKGREDPLKYIKAGGCISVQHWDLKCKLKNLCSNSFFYVSCPNTGKVWPSRFEDWVCTTQHNTALYPYCCDYICPPGYGKWDKWSEYSGVVESFHFM